MSFRAGSISAIVVLLVLLPFSTGWPEVRAAAGQKPVPIEELTEEMLEALPDAQIVTHPGGKITVGQLREALAKQKSDLELVQERVLEQHRAAEAQLKHFRRILEHERQDRIANAVVEVDAEMDRIRRSRAGAVAPGERLRAIREQAIELRARVRKADRAERTQINRRAAELLRELDGMGLDVSRFLASGSGES